MHERLRRTCAPIVLLTALLLGLITSELRPLHAGENAPSAEQVSVELRAVCTRYRLGNFEASQVCASSGADLAPGETAAIFIAVGMFGADGKAIVDKLDISRVGTPQNQAMMEVFENRPTPDFWWVEFRSIESRIGLVEVEIEWTRLHGDREDRVARSDGGSRRVILGEGQRHVLDYIAASVPSFPYANVTIEISGDIAEDPSFAQETLSYDLWYRHTDSDGQVVTRRVALAGLQGERIDYRFAPLRFPVQTAGLPEGVGVDSILEIAGSLQGRRRGDDRIEVRLDASRSIDAERRGRPKAGGIGDAGQKTVSISPGETISLVLPEPGEVHPQGRVGAGIDLDDDGEVAADEVVWVHNGQFYAGHRDELILTVDVTR